MIQASSSIWIAVSFYVHREYIAKELCVNRFEKMPICGGSCYLSKKLSENERTESEQAEIKVKDVQPYVLSSTYFTFLPKAAHKKVALPVGTLFLPENDFSKSVFQPPQAV